MNIAVIGINHRTAPLAIREQMSFTPEQMRTLLHLLHPGILSECFMVSTCNRTEIYGVPFRPESSEDVIRLVMAQVGIPDVSREQFYAYQGQEALRHLFRVVTGADSMIVGDVQITGQVKQGFGVASEEKTTGWLLKRVMQSVLRVGKRARKETSISEGSVSVSAAAVDKAVEFLGSLAHRTALIIGAGETGKLSAKHLRGRNIGHLIISNRTREHAVSLQQFVGGEVAEMSSLPDALDRADVVITSVASGEPILQAADIRSRAGRPLLVIDLGVPRNVAADVGDQDGVTLIDLDNLANVVDVNVQKRQADLPKIDAIVEEEMEQLFAWYRGLVAHPTIQELHSRFEMVRNDEVQKFINRFSEPERELVDLLTRRIVNKLLHCPTVMLKQQTEEENAAHKLTLFRHIFGLSNT